jgi:hypothetical protein
VNQNLLLRKPEYFFESPVVIVLIMFQHCIMLSRMVLLEDLSLNLRLPAILTKISCGFPEFLQPDVKLVPANGT